MSSRVPVGRDGIYRVLVLPDMQVPYEDRRAVSAVEQYMADERWHEVIIMGDFLDLDCISHHNKNNLRAVEGKTVLEDYKAGNAILDRWQTIVHTNNPDARWVFLEGNHEHRVERWIDQCPQLRGLMEVRTGLRLDERGMKYIRWGNSEVYELGHAHFIHGLDVNRNHPKTMADKFGVNVFYGHTHDVQCHAKMNWGNGKAIVAQSLGCLCLYDQSYAIGTPKNWQHAIGIFYFTADGNFTYYVPRIINHRFVAPNGKVYDGRVGKHVVVGDKRRSPVSGVLRPVADGSGKAKAGGVTPRNENANAGKRARGTSPAGKGEG